MTRAALVALCLVLPLAAFAAGAKPRASEGTPAREKEAVDDAQELVPRQFEPVEEALSSWDIPGARAALERLKQGGAHSELLDFFGGRVAFEDGQYPEAIALLEKAGAEDVEDSYLRLAKETAQVVQGHAHAESEHFVLSYPPGKDAVLVPYALETLEQMRTALEHDLGYAPPQKIRVEVVNDAKELSQVSTLSVGEINTTGTIAICKFNKLMVTSPKAVLRGYDWRDTLAHEFTHLVVSQKSRNETPIWLQEGLAKYLESRWRGAAGLSMPPATLALLGEHVKKNTLIPFARMHPSMAKLPSHEDAAVAFAEVFFAVDLLYREHGVAGLRTLLTVLAQGRDQKTEKEADRRAVEAATGAPFAAFEKAWQLYLKKLPYPPAPLSLSDTTVTLKEGHSREATKNGKEIAFWDFNEVREPDARRAAHLGELFRARNHNGAAAEEFQKAYHEVGDRYPSVSNKLALSLLALHRLDEAERVLRGSLQMHPGSPATQVHLGRIYLARNDGGRAKTAFMDALASDPFDPEIHLSLLRVSQLLKDPALGERARAASEMLTGLPPARVEALAQALGSKNRDLEDRGLPTDPASGSTATADAGVVTAAPPGAPAGALHPDAFRQNAGPTGPIINGSRTHALPDSGSPWRPTERQPQP